jgi:hypothetical protein
VNAKVTYEYTGAVLAQLDFKINITLYVNITVVLLLLETLKLLSLCSFHETNIVLIMMGVTAVSLILLFRILGRKILNGNKMFPPSYGYMLLYVCVCITILNYF